MYSMVPKTKWSTKIKGTFTLFDRLIGVPFPINLRKDETYLTPSETGWYIADEKFLFGRLNQVIVNLLHVGINPNAEAAVLCDPIVEHKNFSRINSKCRRWETGEVFEWLG